LYANSVDRTSKKKKNKKVRESFSPDTHSNNSSLNVFEQADSPVNLHKNATCSDVFSRNVNGKPKEKSREPANGSGKISSLNTDSQTSGIRFYGVTVRRRKKKARPENKASSTSLSMIHDDAGFL
jgi:hypothetical protein